MDERTQRREVRVEDPSLSDEANRILTEELRAVVGRDAVELPVARERVERARHGRRSGALVAVSANRLALGMTFLAALVVGAILSLATGSWWFLLLPLAAHAVATIAVVLGALQLTTETEHLSPGAAARLEDEGVPDPDALFSDLVEEFSPRGRREGEQEPPPAHEDPAQAAAEQRGATTPSQEGSRPVGP